MTLHYWKLGIVSASFILRQPTYVFHHVVSFALPFAEPPMQTQLQIKHIKSRAIIVVVFLKRISYSWPARVRSFTALAPTLWYSLLFSHSRSFSMDLLIYGARAALDGKKKKSPAVLQICKQCEFFSPSCWGRWRATNWSPTYSNSRGSHRGATAHWLAMSSSGSCLHGWYWLWILLVPPEEGWS